MKRYIEFEVWTNDEKKVQNIKVDFETDGKDVMKDAFAALKKQMLNDDYSVSYWNWLDETLVLPNESQIMR